MTRAESSGPVAADAIAAEVPVDPSWSVLDYGAGTGLLAFALADRVGDMLLLDFSDGMVEVARRRTSTRAAPACGPRCTT